MATNILRAREGRLRTALALWIASLVGVGVTASLAGAGCQEVTDSAVRRNTANSGDPGADGGGNENACADNDDGPPPGQRLTKLEYNNVIRDLFGLTGDFAADFSEPGAGATGFTTESSAQNISAGIVLDFYRGAGAVVEALFAKSPNPLLTCTGGEECAAKIIRELAPRAFRRPVTDDEVNPLVNLYKASTAVGLNFNDAMKSVVTGILMAPQFIFRPYDLPTTQDARVPLTSHELASRMSFFIWGSIPDSALAAAAADGTLTTPAVLESHVRRMLKDPRSSYLKNFSSQWLSLDELDTQQRSQERFPDWGKDMQASMKNETLTFMNNVVESDVSVMDLIAAKYSFVDKNVSKIYGLTGAFEQFTRVPLDQHRSGLLTQPAVLAVTSSGDATSPVRRGKWVLQKLLCSAPPPPPPGVPMAVDIDGGAALGESQIRERMAQHRTLEASCNGCHSAMDPIGLTFENYDSMGFFRTTYSNGVPVDASGQLPSGEKLADAMDLAALLEKDSRFPTCFTARLSSFAEGEDMTTPKNRCGIETIAKVSVGTDKSFSQVIVGIVSSRSFLTRAVQP